MFAACENGSETEGAAEYSSVVRKSRVLVETSVSMGDEDMVAFKVQLQYPLSTNIDVGGGGPTGDRDVR